MNTSTNISEIAKALSEFQGKITPVPKDATNPFYKSKYADLSSIISHVQELLKKNGLSVSQLPNESDDKISVTTLLMHTSGEWLSGTISMKPAKLDPQGFGSAMTYARRYSLSAILGIASEEDDDGNSASKVEPKTVTQVDKPKFEPKVAPKDAKIVEKKPVEVVKTAKVSDTKVEPQKEDKKSFSDEIKTSLNMNHLRSIWVAIEASHKNKEITDVELEQLRKEKDAKKEALK